MTALTKEARLHAVAGILKETFTARQDDLMERIEAAITELAKAEWPRFYELRAEKESREFVMANTGFPMEYKPSGNTYGAEFNVVKDWAMYAKDGSTRGAKAKLLDVPYYKRSPKLPDDHQLVDEYKALVDLISDAREKLINSFNAYKSREKMEAELPDLARYLPPRVVTGTGVIVKPADIMADLAKVGIPPKKVAA